MIGLFFFYCLQLFVFLGFTFDILIKCSWLLLYHFKFQCILFYGYYIIMNIFCKYSIILLFFVMIFMTYNNHK